MKLATLNTNNRDGQLIVVSRDLERAIAVPAIANTLQQAIDDWKQTAPKLNQVYEKINNDTNVGDFFNVNKLSAPLPRAYQWLDGSVYLNHVELMRKARVAPIPEIIYKEPLMYQGISDNLLGPTATICMQEEWGIDYEAEIVVVTNDIKQGSAKSEMAGKIILLGLVNDISLRNLIPTELSKSFGFLQSKPANSFSPVFATPDELGDAWVDFKLHLPLLSYVNYELFGHPNAGNDMYFDYGDLLTHACKTRSLSAGTLVGGGTVSNYDEQTGVSCLAELRSKEMIKYGEAKTPYLQQGDCIRIEMLDEKGKSIFGAIENKVI